MNEDFEGGLATQAGPARTLATDRGEVEEYLFGEFCRLSDAFERFDSLADQWWQGF
jgi:hypothetical protein